MASASEHGSTVLNKIIIPVITTVLGATAIYFLGFNNKKSSNARTDMEQMLISKDATLTAWKSFVTTQNVYYKNQQSLQEEFSQKIQDIKKNATGFRDLVPALKDFQDETMRERKKTAQDMDNIIKTQDVDRDFVSMLSRIQDDSKDYDNKITEFFDNVYAIFKSDKNENEKGQLFKAEADKFELAETKMNGRIIDQAESISRVLAAKYTQAFDLNELQAYVAVKAEKDKKPDDNKSVANTENGKQAPVDPNASGNNGTAEVKQPLNPPGDNGGRPASSGNTDNNSITNVVQPTKSLLTGQWSVADGSSTLELSANGKMFWMFKDNRYTSGDWAWANGKIEMNATNPDTQQKFYLVGTISNFNNQSFTLTFPSGAVKGVYNFTKKR